MNDLFQTEILNILPYDGITEYHGKILPLVLADHYLRVLLNNIAWQNDEAIILGRHIMTARKVAWYGDESYAYTYSNITKHALPWTDELRQLKSLIEQVSDARFNSCLLNLYHNGSEGMAWHSDDEPSLGHNTTIASLTLGAERKFSFKHKRSKETVSLVLEHGSLLVMKGTTQTHWLHRLPQTTQFISTRVNLTFRTIVC